MTEITEAVDVEEALRLAEVGEYLYDEKAFSAGNGYDEPREFSICWDWQQSKPNEYGQGVLLAEAVAWHREMAADGIETQANKLRAELTRLQEENGQLRLAICGGEDAPGYADSLPLADILGVAANNLGSWREASDRAARLQEEVKGLRGTGQFLIDRISDLNPDDDDVARQYHGHVVPAVSRFAATLQGQQS